MQPITLLLFLTFITPTLSARNYQDRKVTPNTSNGIERNVKLERLASARYRKIGALLQPDAKRKLADSSNKVLKSLAKHSDAGDPLDLARVEVESHFDGLSAQQSDLLIFYVLEDVAQLLVTAEALNNKLDSMSEMSEETSLRLQMLMDRRSKFISTLSNLMKKISTTQDAIVQNLK